MKLYNMNLSNFATKCRIAIYDKNAPVEIVGIPGNDLKSPEYLKINPLGKTPSLDADGLLIPESETINEYLEDKFPNPPLMPKSPEGRAKVRSFTRFHDLYLEPPLRALFPQMNPKTRDEKVVNEKLTELNARLDQLDKMLAESGFAMGAEFTLADCAAMPALFYGNKVAPFEGRWKNLTAYLERLKRRPSVARVLRDAEPWFYAFPT